MAEEKQHQMIALKGDFREKTNITQQQQAGPRKSKKYHTQSVWYMCTKYKLNC